MDDAFIEALAAGAVWERLYAVVQNLVEEHGEYARADVVEQCEDAALLELVNRACARVVGTHEPVESFLGARHRLREELKMQRMGKLQEDLRRNQADPASGDQAFKRLLETARGQDAALAAQTLWNAPSAG